MTDLFSGRSSFPPWIESAVLARLQNKHETRTKPRCVQVLEVLTDRHILVGDGHSTIVAQVSSQDDPCKLQPGVLKIFNWRVVVEKYDGKEESKLPYDNTLQVFKEAISVYVEVEGSSLEYLGSLDTVSGKPVPILQSTEVLRHLQRIEQLPVGDLSSLLQAAAVDELIQISSQAATEPLPIGNLSLLLETENQEVMDALVAAATSPQRTDSKGGRLSPPQPKTLTLDSDSESDSVQSVNQGIGAVLMDEGTDDDEQDEKEEEDDEILQRNNKLDGRKRTRSDDVDSHSTSRPDSPSSKSTEKQSNTGTNKASSHFGTGDSLREWLFASSSIPPLHLAEPFPLKEAVVNYAGDNIRIWLVPKRNKFGQ